MFRRIALTPIACPDEHRDNSLVERGADGGFLQEKFMRAFSALLLDHAGGVDSEVCSMWWKVIAVCGKQYMPPYGRVGTRFVNLLSEDI